MKIKELEKEFLGKGDVKGFKFTQLEETPEYYIYKKEFVRSDGSTSVSYEVFERVVCEITEILKNSEKYKEYTHRVVYPSSSQFGLTAWEASTQHHLQSILYRKFGVGQKPEEIKKHSYWSLFN